MYFGKQLATLTPAEAAMLAGLPQAPSRQNPFVNPKRAQERQHYVLRRMREVGWLSDEQYKKALAEPLRLNPNQRESFALRADYIAEMARAAIYEQYGEPAYVSGLRVHTTIKRKHQEAAIEGLRQGVLEYDHRHGYRGPEGFVALPAAGDKVDDAVEEALQERETVNDLVPAVVIEATPREVKVMMRRGDEAKVSGDGLRFAARALTDKNPDRAIRRGAIIRLQAGEKGAWTIMQLPKVEAALVALDPANGAIQALAGGFDFNANKFNHATQAWRQPGSSFKPFIYSAALEKGFTPATVLNDAPFVIEAAKTGGQLWEPKNYDNKYDGPMRLRTALARSKNMVSIRLLQAIGPHYAQDYIQRFGFDPKMHPAYLTMALGAGSATPLQMSAAYAIFANGGYRVKPYFISRVEDNRGETLYVAKPEVAGVDAERVLDERNAFLMATLMRDVVRYGTAAKAMELHRQDLAGKTGTTNDHIDAWFAGFNGKLVAVSWIGFDTPANLGPNETGGQAALPIDRARAAFGRGRHQHQPRHGPARARRTQQDHRIFLPGIPAAGRGGWRLRARRQPAGRRSEEPDFLNTAPSAARGHGQDKIATRQQPAPAPGVHRRAHDGRGRHHRLCHREDESRAAGGAWRGESLARQPRDRGGAARVPGPLSEGRAARAIAALARSGGHRDA